MLFEIPEGTKDFLLGEAKWKNEIEDLLQIKLRAWGYRQVITPSYEYLTTLSQGEESRLDYFSFLSENGATLALRNDFTTPIARIASIALAEEIRPLRLFYRGNLFRLKHRDKREFWQAGAELIGDGSRYADAEILALAMSALDELGIKDWGLDIGHRKILQGVLEDSALSKKAQKQAEALLLQKDYAGLKALVEQEKTGYDLLLLPSLRGQEEILKTAKTKLTSPKAKEALGEIEEILKVLKPYGYTQVNIDLAMVKDLSYYTGMFFECYAPGLAGIICTGGRYDQLLANFNHPEPAVGLAIGIDEIMEVLAPNSQKRLLDIPDLCLVFSKIQYEEAVIEAEKKRQTGFSVVLAKKGPHLPRAKKYLEL